MAGLQMPQTVTPHNSEFVMKSAMNSIDPSV